MARTRVAVSLRVPLANVPQSRVSLGDMRLNKVPMRTAAAEKNLHFRPRLPSDFLIAPRGSSGLHAWVMTAAHDLSKQH
jgi:hypothetical protein